MNVLSIDTTGTVLSAALAAPDGTRLAEIDAGSRHSELLMELVDSLFKSAGLKPEELGLAACMKGPGSFTGLRIAYAAVKGLSLALGIPLAAVPTLDCIGRHLAVWPGLVLPVMDAKKSCFFAAFYRHGERLGEYLDAEPEMLTGILNDIRLDPKEPVILTGPGAAMLLSFLSPGSLDISLDPFYGRGRALELLEIVSKNPALYREDENADPLYLRKSDAENLTCCPSL